MVLDTGPDVLLRHGPGRPKVTQGLRGVRCLQAVVGIDPAVAPPVQDLLDGDGALPMDQLRYLG